MTYDFTVFDGQIKDTTEWLSKEYTAVRTGRATPMLLDSIRVDSYGTKLPIQQLGSVGVEDPRTIRVTPWDVSQAKDIERAITEANLGVSVATDEKGLRVIFPELTSERREQLMKLARTKLEDARVSLRQARDEVVKDIEKQEKAGDLSEDEKFRIKEDIQKRMDAANKELDAMLSRKESEISE